jgi:hypothetical protein
MRGSTSKLLRKMSSAKYREMLATGELQKPESLEHAQRQRRVLYQQLKRAWKNSPWPVRAGASKKWRDYVASGGIT